MNSFNRKVGMNDFLNQASLNGVSPYLGLNQEKKLEDELDSNNAYFQPADDEN